MEILIAEIQMTTNLCSELLHQLWEAGIGTVGVCLFNLFVTSFWMNVVISPLNCVLQMATTRQYSL